MKLNNILIEKNIYDISVPLNEYLPVFPGQSRFKREIISSIEKGDRANVSKIEMTTHTGTHVDAPFHFINNGLTIDKVPFYKTVGLAKVFELNVESKINKIDLDALIINEEDIVIFKTRNSELWKKKEFSKDYVYLTPEAANFLLSKKVKAVGVDYMIPEKIDDLLRPVHKILLKNNIILIEGLNLTDVPAGEYILICLPLRISKADAAPARAFLVDNNNFW